MDFLSTDTKEIRGRRKVEEKNVQGLSNYDSTIEMKNVAQNQIGETERTTGIEWACVCVRVCNSISLPIHMYEYMRLKIYGV